MQNTWKMTETLTHWYSSESTQRELSNEYLWDRDYMVLKNICVLVLWTKVASTLEGLKDNSTMSKTEAQLVSYGILYLNPSSYQCQPSYKKYIAALTSP